ncbi:MAG: MarR family EPS-associated transcriptional regulator [Desulfobacterales bacterium]|nr:MarR family EPS-associated transcriptional regulator [Desulfobacterales bacterium]
MKLSENHFQILDALDREEISTQRHLAEHTGISLGQVNYVLKSFLEKGLIKIGNFRKNPRKIGYVYLLTPKGIEAKSRLAARFVLSKLKEYNQIREKLAARLIAIEERNHTRIIFIGPAIVKELVDSTIRENSLNLTLVGHCHSWQHLKDYDPDSFDTALLFEGSSKDARRIRQQIQIAPGKLAPLW